MSKILDRVRHSVFQGDRRRKALIMRAGLALVTLVLISFPLVLQTPPVGLTEGEPAPRTFRANRTVQFVDEEATERARAEAAESVEPVTVFDPTVLAEARGDVSSVFESFRSVRGAYSEEPTATLVTLSAEYPHLDSEWIEALLAADETTFNRSARASEQLATTVLSRRFSVEEMDSVYEQVNESAQSLPMSPPIRNAMEEIVSASVRPTLSLDAVATEAARAAAAESIDPTVIIKQVGDNIVQRGEIVTSDHLEIIRRLGLLDQGGSFPSLAAAVLLACVAVGAALAYLWRFDRPVFDRTRDVVLVAVLLLGAAWVTRAILWFFPEVSLYLLPVPLPAMLATLLVDARAGLLTAVLTTVVGVLLGFSGGASIIAMLLWAVLAVVAMSFMTDRPRFFHVGVFLVASGAVLAGVATLAGGSGAREALSAAGNGALGGVFAVVAGYGLLPLFEHVFGVTSDVRLLELASPAHSLIRRLMMEAPGTYSHSVLAGNLAEAAAEEVGANPLLARVGAYYHDVGKLRRPEFFIENQTGPENPHDSTTPSLSAIIITAHVREGLELAKEYRLPPEVVDIIEQHHGDSLVSYFYNKAAESETDVAVVETDYRYTFSRPQSREAALVMLADAAEATVRSLKKPSPTRIETAVRRVVEDKMADGQLHDSELTLADLEKVMQVYSKMLASVYHRRVDYPETKPRRQVYAHQHH